MHIIFFQKNIIREETLAYIVCHFILRDTFYVKMVKVKIELGVGQLEFQMFRYSLKFASCLITARLTKVFIC